MKQKLVGCGDYAKSEKYLVEKISQLPPSIKESSGIAFDRNNHLFFHISDGGNASVVYCTDSNFKLVNTIPIPQNNVDFEDLSLGENGLYIADVGNNTHLRPQGKIIDLKQSKETVFSLIGLNFEAMVVKSDTAYLFSKQRNKTSMFSIGLNSSTLTQRQTLKTRGYITGAALNTNKTRLALLSYGHILIFDISGGMHELRPLSCVHLAKNQTEAICFINETDMVVTNEAGAVFKVILRRSI